MNTELDDATLPASALDLLRSEGWTVDARSGRPVAELKADLADRLSLKRLPSCEALIHLAGSLSVEESVAEPAKYYRNNTLGTLQLAEAALAAGVERFIFSSSAAVYGVPETSPVGEDAPTRPINCP